MISRKPLSAADIERGAAAALAKPRHDSRSTCRATRPKNQFGDLLRAPDPAEYERNYQFDITPVSDNRPFFFYTVQPRDSVALPVQRIAAGRPITRSTWPCRCSSGA